MIDGLCAHGSSYMSSRLPTKTSRRRRSGDQLRSSRRLKSERGQCGMYSSVVQSSVRECWGQAKIVSALGCE